MRYCKYLSSENGATLSRYALVEKRNGVLWAALPMQAPQEDLSARVLGGLPVPTTAVDFEPVPISDLHLLPPVAPSKILCVGRNYRDQTATAGRRYAYRVTAVDTAGNESAPSADVQETLREQ